MTSIIKYLINGELPFDKNEARALRRQAIHYAFKSEQLYKRGYLAPLLKCITPECGLHVIQEIHEVVCGNHSSPRSLLHKVIQHGYFWPKMVEDTQSYVQACEPCQSFFSANSPTSRTLEFGIEPSGV